MTTTDKQGQDSDRCVADRFSDPVAYLRRLGIEAQMVEVLEAPLGEAA